LPSLSLSRAQVVIGRVGTATYMAPEVKKGKYGPACDWFSLGATIGEMAQGEVSI
jgi:serine/threonine protein kinase